jgi:hypothetical protein
MEKNGIYSLQNQVILGIVPREREVYGASATVIEPTALCFYLKVIFEI